MAVCVKVIIDDLINKIDKPYDYYVPDELAEYIGKWQRVIVPFSRANIRKKALVIDIYDSADVNGFKPVLTVVDETPLLNELQVDIFKLLKSNYFVTYYKALKSIVPRGIDFVIKEKFEYSKNLYSLYPALFDFLEKNKGCIDVSELSASLKRDFKECINMSLLTPLISSKENSGQLTERNLVLSPSLQTRMYFYECGS